ncbi:MATE family efflux transporter [Deinococcus peraridilitoris]|uniref:Multidrug-efflux transporter n=1 Tax=Deinococcus peraridilitoris (strain DSM 19664 / LMG 22246 / CIP 109416 / KR-200) TaxID=937777 RepID=L0A2G4_DEIPD|nr:MATE family efflux transporter [Deinococcus peraridilitoris]AFZ67614.1 putative efflux protein, MATE family [Deinococcus peraridilitoris DSM 19664]
MNLSDHRHIARIAVPVSLEMTFQLLLNFGVQLVVGVLGTLALAAVGLVNSLVVVGMVSLSTIGAAAAILAARAHGARSPQAVARVATTAGVLAFLFTLTLCLPAAFFAQPLLLGLGATAEIAATGARYFQLTVLALPFMVHASVTSGVFRSLGQARIPMQVSIFAVLFNGLLAYALVVGLGPLPVLGLGGAALASLIAQGLRAALLFWLLHLRPGRVPLSWSRSLTTWRQAAGQLLTLAFPLAMTQLSWSAGAFLYALLFARLSVSALAASQIVLSLEGVFIVASYGLMSASTTLIGHAVGQGDHRRAQDWSVILQRVGMATGLGFGVLFMASAYLLPHLYPNISPATLQVAFWGIVINAAFQVVKVRNMILGGGVLPSGGDARGVVIGDLIGPFVVGLPLAYLLGFTLELGVWGVFWGRIADEVAKASFFTWRVRRLRWQALTAPRATVTQQAA